jgi:hypothetical protein
MKKSVVAVIALVLLAALGVWYFYSRSNTPAPAPAASQPAAPTALAPEVERVLNDKTTVFQSLAEDPVIVAEVKKANEKNIGITQDQINTIDKEWQASKDVTPFIKTFLENATAKRLFDFQKTNPEFKEIFATDIKGLNVGQTDKTSDYLQSDEKWWTDSFAGGKGKAMHGTIEFDASSQTQGVALYVPIIDPASGNAIGVMKGVLDLTAIGDAL